MGEPAGNGVKKVIVGQNGYMATPAMSALIRKRGLYGGLIMSASHNPAGPEEDWGIKFNYNSGEPAPEKITNEIFQYTQSVSELKMADFPDVDLATIGTTAFGDFEVEVVSPTADYFAVLKEVCCQFAPVPTDPYSCSIINRPTLVPRIMQDSAGSCNGLRKCHILRDLHS